MKWLLVVCLLPVLLAIGALVMNRPPLWEPPGPLVRLKLYLTTHVAETHPEHTRPELRTLTLKLPPETLPDRVVEAMRQLGWQQIRANQAEVRALVVTSLLRFKDDVVVRLESTPAGVQVHVRSESRVGQGDLAANTRHVQDLYRRLTASAD
jgi:uncharacterized protein (DUF1499 family)